MCLGFKYINETKNENKLLFCSVNGSNTRVKDKMQFASSSRMMKDQTGLRLFTYEMKEFTYSELLESAKDCPHNFFPTSKPKKEIPIKEESKIETQEEREDTFAKWLRKACEKDIELNNCPEQFELLLKKYREIRNNNV